MRRDPMRSTVSALLKPAHLAPAALPVTEIILPPPPHSAVRREHQLKLFGCICRIVCPVLLHIRDKHKILS